MFEETDPGAYWQTKYIKSSLPGKFFMVGQRYQAQPIL